MAGSGVGRGRGWLNINKNQNTKPGSAASSSVSNTHYEYDNTAVTTGASNTKYSNVITKIGYFDENDDGILLNQKLKNIIEELNSSCHSAADVE